VAPDGTVCGAVQVGRILLQGDDGDRLHVLLSIAVANNARASAVASFLASSDAVVRIDLGMGGTGLGVKEVTVHDARGPRADPGQDLTSDSLDYASDTDVVSSDAESTEGTSFVAQVSADSPVTRSAPVPEDTSEEDTIVIVASALSGLCLFSGLLSYWVYQPTDSSHSMDVVIDVTMDDEVEPGQVYVEPLLLDAVDEAHSTAPRVDDGQPLEVSATPGQQARQSCWPPRLPDRRRRPPHTRATHQMV